jgi:hypothetical protein
MVICRCSLSCLSLDSAYAAAALCLSLETRPLELGLCLLPLSLICLRLDTAQSAAELRFQTNKQTDLFAVLVIFLGA